MQAKTLYVSLRRATCKSSGTKTLQRGVTLFFRGRTEEYLFKKVLVCWMLLYAAVQLNNLDTLCFKLLPLYDYDLLSRGLLLL